MNYLRCFILFICALVALLGTINCSPLNNQNGQLNNDVISSFDSSIENGNFEAAESQQVEDVQKPVVQEPVKQEVMFLNF